MRISYIKEFVVCSRHLNIRQAADELHMAQSNLSKHIKQLEIELGCKLFSHEGNKMSLTRAGGHFLTGAQSILSTYENLQKTCFEMNALPERGAASCIVVQQHSIVDVGAEGYYRFLGVVRREHPELNILFAKSSRRCFMDELKGSKICLCLDYRCGETESLLADYASKGFYGKLLGSEKLVLWCPRDHVLNKPELSIVDLENIPIMQPCDASAPTRVAVSELCLSHGFQPLFATVPTTCQAEFLSTRTDNAVFLYPQSFTETHLLKGYDDMVSVPFVDEDAQIKSFALTYPSANPFNSMLVDIMNRVD